MRVLSSEIDQLALPPEWAHRDSALTIGAFDGIHLGHRQIIATLTDSAHTHQRLAGLVTFYPHPVAVLYPHRAPAYLTTPGEKTAILERLGLDWTAILPFTSQLAAASPEQFVRHLYTRLNMRSLWVGTDFAFGRDRKGTIDTLRRLGAELDFEVHQLPAISQNGTRISSTHIRTLLRHGQIERATSFLGRFYSICGEVVRGAQRGRCMGFPTANVDVRPDRVVPANGIYAGYASLGDQRYRAVIYIGGRPSFDQGERSIEAHLLDFEGDLYGRDLLVEFVARLRGDQRFADVQDLIAQIARDIENAQALLDQVQERPPQQVCNRAAAPLENAP